MVASTQTGIRMFVYALCEPDGRTIRYIGCTADLRKRLRMHLGRSVSPEVRAWIESLREKGLIPSMIVLQECDGIEAGLQAEREQLRSHSELLGESLLNVRDTGKRQRRRRRGAITFDGRSMKPAAWAKELGISRQALSVRLQIHPIEVALSRGNSQSEPLSPRRQDRSYAFGSESVAIDARHANIRRGLNRIQRFERRQSMAAAVATGLSLEEVAGSFGVTMPTVKDAVREAKRIERRNRKLQIIRED